MSDLSAYLAAAVLLGFSTYRLVTDRRVASNRTQHYGYGLLICLALAMAMLAPATPRALAEVGMSSAVVIVLGEAIRTAAVSLLMFIACSLDRRPVSGTPATAAITAQLAMIALFTAASPSVRPEGSVATSGAGRFFLAAHDLLFACYTEWALVGAGSALGRESRRVGAGPLRTGLRLMLAACAVGAVWTAWTVDDVVHVLRSGTQDGSEDLLSNVLGALCATLIVGGTLVMKWHGLFTAIGAWIHSLLMYHRLGPLWRALRAELPEIALDEVRRRPFGARLPSFDLEFGLYRRVIEIHDGRLALRPYMPERALITEDLDGIRGYDRRDADFETLVEAASIAAALDNRRTGHRYTTPETTRHPPLDRGADGSVRAEAAWLAEVSKAFARIRRVY